jgi:hypothetical protein
MTHLKSKDAFICLHCTKKKHLEMVMDLNDTIEQIKNQQIQVRASM